MLPGIGSNNQSPYNQVNIQKFLSHANNNASGMPIYQPGSRGPHLDTENLAKDSFQAKICLLNQNRQVQQMQRREQIKTAYTLTREGKSRYIDGNASSTH